MFSIIELPITPPRDVRSEAIDHELDRIDDADIADALAETSDSLDDMVVAFVELANCKDILQAIHDGENPFSGPFGGQNRGLLRRLLGSARVALRITNDAALALAEKRADARAKDAAWDRQEEPA